MINNYARQNDLLKEKELSLTEMMSEGLTAVISVKVPEPRFEGRLKLNFRTEKLMGLYKDCWRKNETPL